MSSKDNYNNFIEELKAKSDIVSIISRYITLERKGRSYWARCPFHGEKTPSFTINEADQFYHCFGCGVGGDVIKFVQEIESVDFSGAVHILADLAHMEVPTFSGSTDEGDIKRRKQERDRLIALMKDAARHYVDNLKKPQAKPGLMYFEKRKISPQVARMFGLGYSINFNEIIEFLASKGYSLGEMVKAGVVKEREGNHYDAIGGRIVFPIIDTSSNVIAFCGRTLDSNPDFAKYINTSDTMLFSKSKNLYGINLVKKAKLNGEKIDYMIIVEGHIDVVSLHKAGFNMAVASMGTALTIDQAKLIKRFVDKVYICYDGDSAGKKATLRGLDILKSIGLDVYVMSMPEGLDPDDVINKYGAEGYKKLMQKALPLIDFKLEFLKNSYDVSTPEGKSKYLKEAIGILMGLSEVEREVYLDKVSEISGVLKDFVRRQCQSAVGEADKEQVGNKIATIVEKEYSREKMPIDSKSIQAEKFILSAMLHHKPFAHFQTDITEYFTDIRQEFYKKIIELDKTVSEKDLVKQFYEAYAQIENEAERNVKCEAASEIINYIYCNVNDENDLSYFKDCVKLIVKSHTDREVKRLSELSQKEPLKEKRDEIMQQIRKIIENSRKKVDL